MYEMDDYFDAEEQQIDPDKLKEIIARKRAAGNFKGGDIDYELAGDEASMSDNDYDDYDVGYYSPYSDFENYNKASQFDKDLYNQYGSEMYDDKYDYLYDNYARELAQEKMMNNPDDLLRQLIINRKQPQGFNIEMNIQDVLDKINSRR